MALYIDRHFWLLVPITILLCSVFGARAAASFIEARVLDDAPHASGERAAARAAPPDPAPSKDGDPLAQRNMFCDTCVPHEPAPAAVADADERGVPMTSMPVVLVATNLSSSPGASFASVINTSTRHSGAYAIGQAIPGIGEIKIIRRGSVDFVSSQSGRLERVGLTQTTAAADKAPPPSRKRPGATPAEPATGLQARIDAGIKKIDDTHYEIDRALFAEVTGNPTSIKGARARPLIRDGAIEGMRLYAVRPNSAFAKLGLRSGDTLKAINGIELNTTDTDKLLEAYTKLRTASSLSLAVERRGEKLDLSYRVR